MLVKNIMTEPMICCTPWDSVRYAAGADGIPFGRCPAGCFRIVTDRDLCSRVLAVEDRPTDTRVVDVMTPVPVTCEPHDDLSKCLDGRGTATPVLKTLARTPKRTGTLQVSA